ncbi:Nicotinate-nucleotide diphosphorylase [Colletotrichum asianum]
MEQQSFVEGQHDLARKDGIFSGMPTKMELSTENNDVLSTRWNRLQHQPSSRGSIDVPSESAEASADTSDATTDIDSSSTMSESLTIDQTRRLVVDKLMSEFKLMIDQRLEIKDCVDGTSSKLSDGREPREETQVKPSQLENKDSAKRTQFLRKRVQAADDGGEEDEEEQPRKKRPESDPVDDRKRKLACPFYRRNPERHKRHRSCAGPGWSTIHRLKEHIFRQHSLPIYCPRCSNVFGTESGLHEHLLQTDRCNLEVAQFPEGYTKEQERSLRKKSKGTDEEKWRFLYKILFPDDPENMIPTPYYLDNGPEAWQTYRDRELTELERYLRLELPRMIRRQLEEMSLELMPSFENQIRSQVVDVVQNAHAELFRSYRQMNQQSTATPNISHEDEPANPGSLNGLGEDIDSDTWIDFSALYAPPPMADDIATFSTNPFTSQQLSHGGSARRNSDSGYYGSNQIVNGVERSAGPEAGLKQILEAEKLATDVSLLDWFLSIPDSSPCSDLAQRRDSA